MRKLSIIIPVFNEETTIEEIIRRVSMAPTLGYEKEIIVVDDGSTDNSKFKVQSLKLRSKIKNLKLIIHEKTKERERRLKVL